MISAVISTAGGTILLILGWLLGGRQKVNLDVKKGNADATVIIQGMFDTFAKQYEKQYNTVLLQVDILQKQVVDQDLRNAITLEASESWERKFNELQILSDEKLSELQKESEARGEKLNSLQKEHDNLKKAFDSLKKSMK